MVGIGSRFTPQLMLQVAILKSVTIKGVLLGSMKDVQEVLQLLQQKKVKFKLSMYYISFDSKMLSLKSSFENVHVTSAFS